MKSKKISLQQKLWMIVFVILFLSLVFGFILSQIFYEKLYVEYVETNLLNTAEMVAKDYNGGEITDEFRDLVEWTNTKMTGELFVVNNPKELSACLPLKLTMIL